MVFKRIVLSSFLALTLLSCGRAPKSFDVKRPDRDVPVTLRTPFVNATAAADSVLQTRRNEQVVFLVALGHAKEQPVTSPEPSSVTLAVPQSWVPAEATSSPATGVVPPDWVCQRESHCTYGINTGNGYYGKWQFHPGTWTSGANQWNATHVEQIPNDVGAWSSVQPWMEDAVAEMIYAGGAGCGHWAACG